MSIKRIALTVFIVFLLSVSTIVRLPQVFFVASVFISLFLSGYLWARFSTEGLVGEVKGSAVVTEGQRVRIEVTLHNESRLPKATLEILEVVPQGLATTQDAEAEEARSGDYTERTVAYIPFMMPHSTVKTSFEVQALKRGYYKLGPLGVRGSDPIGLFERVAEAPEYVEVTVLPQVFETPTLRFPGGDFSAQQSSASPAFAPVDTDFYGVRQYQPGDSLRFVHWRATAKTGKLSVLQFDKPMSDDIALVVDLSRGRDYGEGRESTLEYAIRLAASLGKGALEHNAQVQVACLEEGIPCLRTFRGAGQVLEMLMLFARLENSTSLSFKDFSRQIAGQLAPGIGVVLFAVEPERDSLEAARTFNSLGHPLVSLVLRRDSFTSKNGEGSEEAAYSRLREELAYCSLQVAEIYKGDNLPRTVNSLAVVA